MPAQRFELVFGPQRREISDLRLEGADQVGRAVDDCFAEGENTVRLAAKLRRHTRDIGVETNAKQRIAGRPCAA